MFMVLL